MNKKILGTFILLFGLSVIVLGQTKEDVVNTYNKAVELANTDPKAAVELFEEALAMAKSLGADADDIKQLIESQLPTLQYKYATNLYREKNIDAAIPNFILAQDYAIEYGDEKTLQKATDIIPKLFFSKGNSYYKSESYDSAIIYFDKALEIKPDYAKIYLSKALLYKKQDNNELMMENLEKAISVGTEAGDEKTVANANKMIRDNYLKAANQMLKDENFQGAIDLATQANSYGEPKAQSYYILAVAYNKLSQWDNAINAANEGLAIEKDKPEAKAKFYFELGNAHLGLEDNTAACTAYKSAAYGSYTKSANYQIETVLQCQ